LQPYLLREYQYRWYLVGIPEGEREPKNYGLDRIQRLDVLPETFVRTREAYVREKFADTVGLTFSAGEPVAVTVRCTELTGKYLQTLPIHSSQEIVDSGGERWTVRYYVVPNFEFEQKLLMHLYQLEVVEPEWFRKAFGLRVREAVRVYESNGE
jgi:predicted DNA-binding transcriptional regulator YafY